MRKFFRDSGHLIRPAVVLLAGLGIFMVIRSAVVPKAFGQYGHYRPGALAAIRQHPAAYAGQGTCVLCHEDEGKVRGLLELYRAQDEIKNGQEKTAKERLLKLKRDLKEQSSQLAELKEGDPGYQAARAAVERAAARAFVVGR